jgi:DNA repair exonuclease SbcCD ATPase subunit
MDVKLQNAYVEVLLDNFLSVVKQNVMFQAQLKTLNDTSEELVNTKKALEDLNNRYRDCETRFGEASSQINSLKTDNINEINALKTDISNKHNQIQQSENITNDKNRLQSAVNDYMKQVKKLEDEKAENQIVSNDLKNSISILNKYISNLEPLVPVTKLKKLKSEFESKDDTVKNGGSF